MPIGNLLFDIEGNIFILNHKMVIYSTSDFDNDDNMTETYFDEPINVLPW